MLVNILPATGAMTLATGATAADFETTALNPLIGSALYVTRRMDPSASTNEYSPVTTSPCLDSDCDFWSPVTASLTE